MSITDELREWFKDRLFMGNGYAELTAIANFIDAEHEEALQREHEKAYDMGYAEGMGMANAKDAQAEYLRGKNDGYDEGWDAGFASADDWLGQHEDAMAEHGWIRLPKDADGEPFRIGDKVDSDHYEDGTVIGIHYLKAPNGRVFEGIAVQPNGWDVATWRDPEEYAHHHAPTVEDVLREMADRIYADEDEPRDRDSIVAEYAKRLTLAEVEDA